ncbi:MAG: hypothetical protein ACJAWF_002061, partial [Candidatus Azotimanducaceae bacterium]
LGSAHAPGLTTRLNKVSASAADNDLDRVLDRVLDSALSVNGVERISFIGLVWPPLC